MSRPKLNPKDKKGKLGISLSKETIKKLNSLTNNKSFFIELAIVHYINHFKNDDD